MRSAGNGTALARLTATPAYQATPAGTRVACRRMAQNTAAWMTSQAPRSDQFWEANRP